MRRVNVGCGYNSVPGWINYDYNKFVFLARIPPVRFLLDRAGFLPEGYKRFMRQTLEHDIRFANAGHRIPEAPGSVDVVYASHMLEHLDREETQVFLKELKRIMKPGAIVRIVVPDFEQIISGYLESKDPMRFIDDSDLVGAKPKRLLKKVQYLIQGHGWHFCMYNHATLAKLFEEAGFREISLPGPKETRIPAPYGSEVTEHHDINLYLEAIR